MPLPKRDYFFFDEITAKLQLSLRDIHYYICHGYFRMSVHVPRTNFIHDSGGNISHSIFRGYVNIDPDICFDLFFHGEIEARSFYHFYPSTKLTIPEDQWFDHEQGKGGAGLELICRELNLNTGAACEWAKDWLGFPARWIATTVLGNQSSLYLDRASTVNVQILQGSLSSCSEIDLYNGANAALLGDEIVQFQTATVVGQGLYTLSNILRGRRGTEWATGTHAVGENFVMLNAGAVEFVPALLTDRGRMYEFRALSNGQTLGDAQDNVFTYGLATLQPFAPVNLRGVRMGGTGTDCVLIWTRRARLHGDWVDYIDEWRFGDAYIFRHPIAHRDLYRRAASCRLGRQHPRHLYRERVSDQLTVWAGEGVFGKFVIKVIKQTGLPPPTSGRGIIRSY
jgi:hypothetical protein